MKGNGTDRSQGFIAQDRAQNYAVRVWFRERGQLVFDDLGPLDRYLAELVCVGMANGIERGGVRVHVERALIVRWLA